MLPGCLLPKWAWIGEAPKAYLLSSVTSKREVTVFVHSRRCRIGRVDKCFFGVLAYLSHCASAGAEVRNLSSKSVSEQISLFSSSSSDMTAFEMQAQSSLAVVHSLASHAFRPRLECDVDRRGAEPDLVAVVQPVIV